MDSDEKIKLTDGEDFSSLVIKSISQVDEGNYTCTAKNLYGADSMTTQIIVQAPPEWTQRPKDAIVQVASTAVIYCSAKGSPTPSISWTRVRDNKVIPLRATGSHLKLENVQLSDSGSYSCHAKNGNDPDLTTSFTISVKAPAKIVPKLGVVLVRKGEDTKMECIAEGDSPLKITWSRDSVKIVESDYRQILDSPTNNGLKSVLTLESITSKDAGLYTCTAENGFSRDEGTRKIQVMEVPAMPIDVKVKDIWSRSVVLSWSPPPGHHSPISGYVIYYWIDGAQTTKHEVKLTFSHTSYMLKDLLPGHKYAAIITAVNEVGHGIPSSIVIFTTSYEEPSTAPIDVIAESKGSHTIRVSWKQWSSSLNKIDGFYVGYRPSSEIGKAFTLRSVDNHRNFNQTVDYFLTGVDRGTEYAITVAAYNEAGTGPFSHEMLARTSIADVPRPPTLYLLLVTAQSITISWKSGDPSHDDRLLTGYIIHYRKDTTNIWTQLSIPVHTGTHGLSSDYTIQNVDACTLYHVYVTGSSSFGYGDPSQLLTVKSHCDDSVTAVTSPGHHQSLLPRKFESIASLTAATVVVILAILTSYVCIKKAKLQSIPSPPPFEFLNGQVSDGKDGVYVGTMKRYVELDASGRPVTSGNITHVVDAQGNMYPASAAAYAGVPMVPVQLASTSTAATCAPSTSNFKDRPLPPINNR